MSTTTGMKGSTKTCFGDVKTHVGNQYVSVYAEGKFRVAVDAKQKWTHNYYVARMKKLDKDFLMVMMKMVVILVTSILWPKGVSVVL